MKTYPILDLEPNAATAKFLREAAVTGDCNDPKLNKWLHEQARKIEWDLNGGIDPSLIETRTAALTLTQFNSRKRDSFRAFGTSLGRVKTHDLEVYAFGGVIEIHGPNGERVEFNLADAIEVAYDMMTMPRKEGN